MKLYRHYKNKFYKYLTMVRHSETLEELVLYETLYENDKGKTWVRPKSLFFGELSVDGRTQPRFAPVDLDVRAWTKVSDAEVELIAPIIKQAFGEWDRKWFYSRFEKQDSYYLLVAYVENRAVGFKLGYKISDEIFYSWLGGVVPEFRNLGIASELMHRQHTWCKEQGYKVVRTKSQNRFRSMLLLNLAHDFDIVGTEESDEGPKIVLQKNLY